MTVTLDGTGANAAGNGNASRTMTFSTTNTNDLIVVGVALTRTDSTAPACTSVTATGLSFTKRATKTASVSTNRYELTYWTAPAAAAQTNVVVTCTFASGTNCLSSCALAAFNGLDITPTFDPNVSLPATASATGTNPTVNVSTTNATDVIIGVVNAYASQTVGSGYTLAKQGGDSGAGSLVSIEYQVVSATQTNLPVNYTVASTNWQIIGDAIEQTNNPAATVAMTLTAPTMAVTGVTESMPSTVAMTLPSTIVEALTDTVQEPMSVAMILTGFRISAGGLATSVGHSPPASPEWPWWAFFHM